MEKQMYPTRFLPGGVLLLPQMQVFRHVEKKASAPAAPRFAPGDIRIRRILPNVIKYAFEYLYLEPEPPFKIYIAPAGDEGATIPDDRFEIQNFKSPIEVDIDEKITVIEQAHCALFECISSVIEEIDFDKYQLK